MTLPAGSVSPVGLANDVMASRAVVPPARSAFSVRTAVGESIASTYASAAPGSTPPSRWLAFVTRFVIGEKSASRGMTSVSAPQRNPWLHAPGGA